MSALMRTLLAWSLLLALWTSGSEARPSPLFLEQLLQFAQLFNFFDPTLSGFRAGAALLNGTEQLEQFFLTHGEHSLDSLGELANIGHTFASGK